LLAHVEDGGHGVRDGVVLEALGFADDEDVLEMDGPGVGRRWDGGALPEERCGKQGECEERKIQRAHGVS